jgi:MoxR-like ATPase
MNNKEILQRVKDLLGTSDRVDVDINDPSIADIVKPLHSARLRLDLTKDQLAVDFPSGGSTTMTIYRIGSEKNTPAAAPKKAQPKKASAPKKRPTPKRHQHSYVPSTDAKSIIGVMTDDASHIVQLVGPTGCGKTTLVHYLGREMGRKVFQINCRGDMGSESFFGEKTIVVDEATGHNVIAYQKGILEQAMTEGLDDQGNEVGAPAILFLDELPACPAHVAQGLNNFMESDNPKRTLVLDQDGGRVVKSHSGLRIIVAGNTMGRGAHGSEAIHTAQMDALDFSLLSRVAVAFRMGYDREVEKHILAEKVGDDRVSQLILKFRDAIRGHIKAGKLTTPFSTRNVVNIADMYRIWGDVSKAVYQSTFEFLNPEEKATYNETAVAVLGQDLLKKNVRSGVDYM